MHCFRNYGISFSLLYLFVVVDLILTQNCGERKVVHQLIVNGTEAKDGYWPWHTAIFHKEGLSFAYACGGTILDRNTVLTAAHCVVTPYGIIARKRLMVQVGRHRISAASKRVQEHKASELIPRPEYSVNSIKHDIALVILEADITYTDYIQPICLWNRSDDLHAIIGTKATVVGFGIDESDATSDTLREANIPIVSHITCIESNRKAFAYQLTSNMFCAGNRDGIGACNGDSGGGLYFNCSDTWFVRGVVSFTKLRPNTLLCDTNEYTVFTDVAKYLKWIKQHMLRTGDNPIVTGNENHHKQHMPGTGDQPIMTGAENSPNIRLLPMSTCGPNPYANREELSKPVLLGYPWMALLECARSVEPAKTITICHATLISDRYLTTSVYCGLRSSRCSQSSVRLGEYNMNTTLDCAQVDGAMVCSPPVQIIRIESVITHPDYNKPSRANDIALIRLRDRADTSQSNVKPICLPVTNELGNQKSTHYTLTTWTYDNQLRLKPVLERSLREVFPLTECRELFKKKQLYDITTDQMCTKFNEQTCYIAISSAPLQLEQHVQGVSRYVLYGIYSLQVPCGSSVPTVYTNVAKFVDWILENIEE